VGFEKNKQIAQISNELWSGFGLETRNKDFTNAIEPLNEKDKFNLIICNPPYVRHHHLSASRKKRLINRVKRKTEIKLCGYSGLYCYFLMLSHNWMSKNGLAGWLIPSEFMDVNYGKQIKEYLLEKVTLVRIHRFDPAEVQFDDALVSSAVVWLRNTIPSSDYDVEFSYGGTLLNPCVSKSIRASSLKGLHKWSGFPLSFSEYAREANEKTLGSFFTIKRGIATGANDFFVLTKQKAENLQIPEKFLVPVLPPPRNLDVKRVESDQEGNPLLDERLFLFSSNLPEEKIKKNYPAVWKYLKKGKKQKINKRYICKHRSPWYSQENRPPAPLLFNIIGRPSNHRRPPYRFVLNKSQATATNNYLMLYPNAPLQKLLDADSELINEIWVSLNNIPLGSLLREGRVYGGGVNKIEPKELRRVSSSQLEQLILNHQRANTV
jgi:hypothetical protein